MTRVLIAIVLVSLVCGCGASGERATTTGPSPQSMSLRVYYLRDGKIAPVRVGVDRTPAVATAALRALLEGPPQGYDSEVPAGMTLRAFTIEFGVARPQFDGDVAAMSESAKAEIVYTLTQFPSVTGVALPGSGEPLTRAEFEQQTPRILVESPLPGDTVTSPLIATGTSNDFEATFMLELEQDGKRLASTFVTATSGNGVRGTFSQRLPFEGSGAATLVAFEQNAGDEGPAELGRVEIPIVLR